MRICVQHVKNQAKNFTDLLPFKSNDISLFCQIEMETGNAEEQPVRDKFD
jgi:hypothetical protein